MATVADVHWESSNPGIFQPSTSRRASYVSPLYNESYVMGPRATFHDAALLLTTKTPLVLVAMLACSSSCGGDACDPGWPPALANQPIHVRAMTFDMRVNNSYNIQ